MSKTTELPGTISPRQAAKQKREIIDAAICKRVPNKNLLGVDSITFNFDDIKANTRALHINHDNEFICKFIKYECVCGEASYANCPFVHNGTSSDHIISTLGELYDVYIKNKKMSHATPYGKIFACGLCAYFITYRKDNFTSRCYKHMIKHFSRKIDHINSSIYFDKLYYNFEHYFTINIRYNPPSTNTLFHLDITDDIVSEYQKKMQKYKMRQCAICRKYFISTEMYELMSHIWACSMNFINGSKKVSIKDKFGKFLADIKLSYEKN